MADHPKYWVGFNMVRGIGPARLRSILAYFEDDLEAAWTAPAHGLRAAGLGKKLAAAVVRRRRELDLDAAWHRLEARGIRVLTWPQPGYPPRLLEIDYPPPVIYLRGQLIDQDQDAVAIVGTRRVTAYGRRVTAELAAFLAENGVTVVSGFARGIDTIAHRRALEQGGRTLAVLGSGVDRIYPPENRSLAGEIVSGARGAVISDYPTGTPPEGANFPPRNRIISGLSLATVVIEAGEKSGALITTRFAVEQGREVLAVPGSIHAPQSRGTNRLVRDGAHPYLQPKDVLDVLDWVRTVQYPQRSRPEPENELERRLLACLAEAPKHMDELSIETGSAVDEVAAALTMMELKGWVEPAGGNRFAAAA